MGLPYILFTLSPLTSQLGFSSAAPRPYSSPLPPLCPLPLLSPRGLLLPLCHAESFAVHSSLVHTGGPIRLVPGFCLHETKGYVSVYALHTKTKLLLWCQRHIGNNMIGHPVHTLGWYEHALSDKNTVGLKRRCVWNWFAIWSYVIMKMKCFWMIAYYAHLCSLQQSNYWLIHRVNLKEFKNTLHQFC